MLEGPGSSAMDLKTPVPADVSEIQQISDAMVGLYKEMFGRGPTKVRTHYAGADTVVCTLEDTFTKAEKNMVANGDLTRLRDIRTYFQYSSETEFCTAVEHITGRKVRAFVSGIDAGQDVSAEVFYLDPKA
jgi:uncharacterized protein YbcI